MSASARQRIVIPGGSGAIGQYLERHFDACGYEVVVLSRGNGKSTVNTRTIHWDGESLGPWVNELEGAAAVINLAGRTVNCRYNEANKREIYDSRLQSTSVIGQAIEALKVKPKVWINSSTATIYRHATDRAQTDEEGEIGVGTGPDADPKWAFSIDVAKRWEDAFFAIKPFGIRQIAMRSSMVFGTSSKGVFDVLSGLARKGLGGRQGSGRQMVSWIHEYDLAKAIEWILQDESIIGTINVCSPNPVSNTQLMSALRRAFHAPIGLAIPKFLLESGAVFMQTESELILKSRWVVPSKLLASGFNFRYPTIDGAVNDLAASLWRR